MALNYAKLFHRRITPQSQPIPGSTQVANSAGGYSWQADDWTRFDRFLILGAEGGTYYIAERDLVKQNHDAVVRCIQADGVRAVKRIVEISDSGRAPKNDPAVFALALVEECIEIEMRLRGILFHSKAELKCHYKGQELKKRYVPDLFVFGCLVVELKAIVALAPEHEAQLLNYMRIARQPVGYLVNFGHKGTLEWKRFILSEFIGQTEQPAQGCFP